MKKQIKIKKMLNKLEKRAYTLIIEAHNVNFAIPKGYGTNSLAYFLPYRKKSLLIEGAINLIKKYALNITWGYRDGVTYFDVPHFKEVAGLSHPPHYYESEIIYSDYEQISFHGIYDDASPRYDKEWCGRPHFCWYELKQKNANHRKQLLPFHAKIKGD